MASRAVIVLYFFCAIIARFAMQILRLSRAVACEYRDYRRTGFEAVVASGCGEGRVRRSNVQQRLTAAHHVTTNAFNYT